MIKLAVLLLGAFLYSTDALSGSLKVVEDQRIALLLNYMEIKHDQDTKYFKFRALSLRELGECDGNPESCPREHFYLTVSTIDLAPDYVAYELPLSHGWELSELKEIDSPGEYQRFIVLTLKRRTPAMNYELDWWVEENYEVHINPWQSTITKIDLK